MKPYTTITFPTGHVFEIKTDVVAENRAATMLAAHPDEFADMAAAMEDTKGLFDDAYAIEDWLKNNMNWDEITHVARLVRFTPPAFDWNDAEIAQRDHNTMMAELNGEDILRAPVELVLSTMALSNQLCNITALNDANGQPFAAFALMVGSPSVIGTYAQGLQLMSDKIVGSTAAPVTQ